MIRADMRVTRWVETYRAQLDRLQLYSARAIFDSARARRARATLEQARAAGRTAEAKEVAQAIRKTAPPQIMLRCQFCSTVIAPSKGSNVKSEIGDSRSHDSGGPNRVRVIRSLIGPRLRVLTKPFLVVIGMPVLQ